MDDFLKFYSLTRQFGKISILAILPYLDINTNWVPHPELTKKDVYFYWNACPFKHEACEGNILTYPSILSKCYPVTLNMFVFAYFFLH